MKNLRDIQEADIMLKHFEDWKVGDTTFKTGWVLYNQLIDSQGFCSLTRLLGISMVVEEK
jgi:hypothetical protein